LQHAREELQCACCIHLEYVDLQVDRERRFEIAPKRFQALRRHAVEKLPRGQGMEAVKEMMEELRTIGP